MLHKYHVMYSLQYYLQFHITAVGLGMYYPWIRQSAYTYVLAFVLCLCFDQCEFVAILIVLKVWIGPGFVFESSS